MHFDGIEMKPRKTKELAAGELVRLRDIQSMVGNG
jgi:hypothetical protein